MALRIFVAATRSFVAESALYSRLVPAGTSVARRVMALNGLDTTRQILQNDPDQKVAILSIRDSEQMIQEALKAGMRLERA